MVARTIRFTVAAAGSAPSWFTSLAEKTWYAVASAATLQSVNGGQGTLSGATFPSMATAWTGGCVDQVRGELVFAANGGHDDYRGNEVYACTIKSAAPAWYRLNDRSPDSAVLPIFTNGQAYSTANTPDGQGLQPGGYAGMYTDGRMRAVHGWHSAIFNNNKVWYLRQASASGGGDGTDHAWSFNRAFAGLASGPGQTPLAWENNAGPWEWLGTSDTGAKLSTSRSSSPFAVATPFALDPVTGKIWGVGGNSNSDWFGHWSSLDTNTGAIQSAVAGISGGGSDGRWAAVVVDPSGQDRWRMFVCASQYTGQIAILDLKAANPYSSAAWSVRTPTNASLLFPTGLGAVYHKPSTSILLGNPKPANGGTVWKLRVPTNGDGTYNSAGTWAVTAISPASGSANPSTGVAADHYGAWSKFNMIEDMGNGQSALVCCMGVTLPTYVYKLPTTELS